MNANAGRMALAGRFLGAMLFLALAPAAHAELPPALLGYIDAAIAEGRLAQAQQLVDNARTLDPDSPAVTLRQAELLLETDPERARTLLTSLSTTDQAAAAAALLAQQALARGDLAAALQEADRAIAANRDNARAWMVRAVAADRLRDWPRADESHAAAIALQPSSGIVRNNRGYSRLLQGRHADAAADFAAAMALAPDQPRIRRNLQLALALQGRYAEALGHGLAVDRAKDLALLGFAAMARGEEQAAAAYFARARDAGGGDNAMADAYLAFLAAQPGQQPQRAGRAR